MSLKSIIPWKKEGQSLTDRQSGGDPFAQLQRRMNGIFDEFFARSPFDGWSGDSGQFLPKIDISETGNQLRVTVELPGLDEKDVDVSVTKNILSIRGEKKVESEEHDKEYYHSERSYGRFERTVTLPEGVDADKAEAKFKKGVLSISIPKKPEARSARRKIELTES